MNFHSPNWLYAAVIAVIATLTIYAFAAHTRNKNLEKFVSAKLLPELSKTYSKTKSFIKCIMFTLAVAAIFVALARPQYGYRWEESRAKGVDVIFAIDTSKSMLAEDIAPNRLERAKLAVLDLAEMLRGDRIGIVAFSGQAFLQCPLTLDYDAFRMSLEALDTNVIQRGGTNIAAAITEAETAFSKTNSKKILILISDGEELEASALEKAKEAAKNSIAIYTLGVGGVKGEAITITDERGRTIKLRDENGNIVTSKLNEKVLGQIAEATGGFYGKISPEAVEKIFTDGIKKAPQEELSSRMKRIAIERFQIPLAIAIVLIALESLVGTRRFFIRRNGTKLGAIVLLCALALAPDTLQAQTQPMEQQPAQNVEKTELRQEEAEDATTRVDKTPTARDIFNEGVDLYKSGQYNQAKTAFENAMKLEPENFPMHSKAIYNIANAQYKTAVDPLADVSAPAEIATKAQQAQATSANVRNQGNVLIQQGTPLLEQEKQMLANAKTKQEKEDALKNSPLKNQQFQQQLKQAISQCQALQKLPEELKKEIATSHNTWEKVAEEVKHCAEMYADSIKLLPSNNAQENLKTAQNTSKKLESQIGKFDFLKTEVNSLQEHLKNLETLEKKLKELVRDDNNQQNQDNQQNKQNQDNQQNQDNKQNQQNKDNQDKQNNQSNQNNQNDNQNQKDNKSENNSEQNKENKSDSQKQNDKNQQNNKDNKDNKDNNKQQENDKSSDKSKDEQAIENKNQQNENKDKQNSADSKKEQNQQKQAQSTSEQEQKKQDEKQAAQSTGAEESKQDNFRKAEGVMTKAEAKSLLESMKDGEKILPLRGFGEQKQRFEKSYKDW